MAFSLQEHVLLLQDTDEVYIIDNEVLVPELSEQDVLQALERQSSSPLFLTCLSERGEEAC